MTSVFQTGSGMVRVVFGVARVVIIVIVFPWR
jgi:hypothetical protein